MTVVHLPITDFGIPSEEIITSFIEEIKQAKEQNQKVGIHCKYGIGRTGTMLALYLIEFADMTPEEALRVVRKKRPRSVESYEQEFFIRNYHKRSN